MPPRTQRRPKASAPPPALLGQRLLVVTGKGGVGKSAVAATLGRLLASRRRDTLLIEVDPRESLHRLLDAEPSAGGVLPAGRQLWFENVQPRDVVERLVRQRFPIPVLAGKFVRSSVFEQFVEGSPGLKEMAVLGHAWQVLHGEAGPRRDAVVLDAPATGHGLAMLEAPQLVADALRGGPLGDLAGQLSAFMADPASVAVVVVTLAEEMPVQESLEFIAALEGRFGRPPELVVANALYPPFVAPARAPAGATAEAVELWRARREVNERELARLRAEWRGPLVELPLFPHDAPPELVAGLLRLLREALG